MDIKRAEDNNAEDNQAEKNHIEENHIEENQTETILIACAMQQDEIEHYREKYHITYPVVYLKRGLHSRPAYLHEMLQEQIDKYQQYDTILLSYGLCGGATNQLVSKSTRLVLPRYHDCIHQLLCNVVDKSSLYMTRAWTIDEESILGQCRKITEEYGVTDGKDILQAIYGGYEKITVIDTDSYALDPVMENAQKAAGMLSMNVHSQHTDCSMIRKLLCGQFDRNFIVCAPGEAVCTNMFFSCGNTSKQ